MFHQVLHILGGTSGKDLFFCVMVVYPVTEENTFRVGQKFPEFRCIPVPGITFQDVFQAFPHFQVVFEVLVPEYIPAAFRSFGHIIYKRFLLKGQIIPSRDLIPDDLYVCKFICQVFEFRFLFICFFGILVTGQPCYACQASKGNFHDFHCYTNGYGFFARFCSNDGRGYKP